MPKAKKLPSGSWNCRVFSHYEFRPDGTKKRIYESFTVSDKSRAGKAMCEQQAAMWLYKRDERKKNLSVYEAVRSYIDSKNRVLSPSTIAHYDQYLKIYFSKIDTIPMSELSKTDVQIWVNGLSGKGLAPKTIRNVFGLFSATAELYGAGPFKITLPAKKRARLHTPTDDEMKSFLEHISDREDLRTAVMLAAFGSLRRSEVCALTSDDVTETGVMVTKAMVKDKDGFWETRQPKTDGSYRLAHLPDFLIKELNQKKGRLVPITPDQLSHRFNRAVASSGLEHFRFHDLRHYYVSISHALGVPDAYIMENGGWKTDYVMNHVYRDALSDRTAGENSKVMGHFESMHHEMQHDLRKKA